MLVQARVERKDIAMTPWEIKAKEFVNCNCAYGCPCQFNALPTKGTARPPWRLRSKRATTAM